MKSGRPLRGERTRCRAADQSVRTDDVFTSQIDAPSATLRPTEKSQVGLPLYTPMIWTGRFVFHLPLVKSGKSMGRLRSATDFSLNADTTLQVAASYTSKSGDTPVCNA